MSELRAARNARLLAAVVFFVLTHAVGLVAMLALLLPGISPHLPLEERARYVREHAAAWRVGWLVWQASALSDVWLTLELYRWARGHQAVAARRWMLAAALLLAVALVPDQYAEARMVGDFTNAAASSAWHEQLRLYMRLSGTWACLAYTAMTLCWLKAVHCVHPARRGAVWAALSMAFAFTGAAIANYFAWHVSGEGESAFDTAVVFNGYAFPALIVLVALAGTCAARRSGRVAGLACMPDPRESFVGLGGEPAGRLAGTTDACRDGNERRRGG